MNDPDVRTYDLGLTNSLALEILRRKEPLDTEVVKRADREMRKIGELELGCCGLLYRVGGLLPALPKYIRPRSLTVYLHGKWKKRISTFEICFQLVEIFGRSRNEEVYACRVWSNIPIGENGLVEKIDKAIMDSVGYDINT